MEINATLIVQLTVFLTLLLWLSKVLFAPLLKLFEEREARIVGAKEEAKQLELEGTEKIALVELRVKSAQKESRELLTALKSDAATYHRQLVDGAKANARQKLAEAKDRISKDLETARSQMSGFVEENANLLSQKFIADDSMNRQSSGSSKMEFRGA